jgi:DNA polymerase-3 subunit alpha
MQIAQVLAGYSLGGADLLRRAMGKKKPEEMAKERVKFETGAGERGIDAHLATAIFDLMEKFAEYGFNKSHSAAYALVSYQTAWLKAHYPAEFMAAVLSSDMDNTDKVVNFLDDARALGLTVLPPAINEGTWMFEALGERRIRYGLGAIKGAGRAAIEAVVEERRRRGPYANLLDLCQRVDLTRLGKRVLEALIHAGALDALGPNRASLMAQLPEATRAADQRLRDAAAGQNDMFGGDSAVPVRIDLPVVPEWPLAQKLTGERDTLGHYLSGHPTDTVATWLAQLATVPIGKLDTIHRPPPPGQERRRGNEQGVTVAGLVVAVRRRGDQMAFIQLEDASGRVEVGFFRDACAEYGALLTRDAILVIDGGLALDEVSGDLVVRARSAATLDEALTRATRQVRVRCAGVGESFAPALARCLAAHRPGPSALRIGWRGSIAEAELECGDAWRVRAGTALVEQLAALPGVVGVDLVLARGASAGDAQAAQAAAG